ncbi:MAG: hypothetical protein PVG85_03680 [Deltaproteobacteria bacterium]|jgi:hypothetical protein
MPSIQKNIYPQQNSCHLVKKGFEKRLCFSLSRYYGTVIYSWINWFAILTVQVYRNVKLMGI